MSLNKPRLCEKSVNSSFRKAIYGILATGFLAIQPGDMKEQSPQPEKDYDYLFEGIDIIDENRIQKKPVQAPPSKHENSEPDCPEDSCRFG